MKSTDGGASFETTPNWIPAASVSGFPDTVTGLNYETDMITDVNGDPHFVGVFFTGDPADSTALYEVYWDGAGWSAKHIAPMLTTNFALPGGLQALNEAQLARSLDGNWLFLTYIDLPDTLSTNADMFATFRRLDGEWETPVNVTQTPDIHEKFTQTADRVSEKDGVATIHTGYTIFGDGDTNDLTQSEFWYLKDVSFPIVGIGDDHNNVPAGYTLRQNYPNPFNPSTTISFSLRNAVDVKLEVFNVTGQKVATLLNGVQAAGDHTVEFNATNLASGLYFYKLSASGFTATKKMVLMK
jgi:hypothetical protein